MWEAVFVAELAITVVSLAVRCTDCPYLLLLGVLVSSRPDPTKSLTPHIVLLGDGLRVNLDRIARIGIRIAALVRVEAERRATGPSAKLRATETWPVLAHPSRRSDTRH